MHSNNLIMISVTEKGCNWFMLETGDYFERGTMLADFPALELIGS